MYLMFVFFSVSMFVQRMLEVHTGEGMSSVSDRRPEKACEPVLFKCGGFGTSYISFEKSTWE